MNLRTFHQLLTDFGQTAIATAAGLNPTEESFLGCLTPLQKKYPADLAKAALETAILRRKARAKFSRADSMYFTRESLEMASNQIISLYRAERFAPFARVADLCCGIGGDTIGLASLLSLVGDLAGRGGERLLALDRDSLHLALAETNLAAYDLRAVFAQSDLTVSPPPEAGAFFFDPGRRAGGRRKFSVRDYDPPLSLIASWLPRPLGIKISPGVQLNELADYDCEIEFISLNGELKEAVLWFGPLKTSTRRATLLSRHRPPVSFQPASSPPLPVPPLSPPRAFLYEPDPAILRAGLVKELAAQLDAGQLDPDIAYLTSDRLTPSPFARAFTIEAHMPFSQKRLRDKLRALNVGQVAIKKRGSPVEVEAFARSLKLKGDEARIVFLTHVRSQPWVLIGRMV